MNSIYTPRIPLFLIGLDKRQRLLIHKCSPEAETMTYTVYVGSKLNMNRQKIFASLKQGGS